MASASQHRIGAVTGAAIYVGALLGPGVLFVPGLALAQAGPASIVVWIALLAGRIDAALAATSGVSTADEVVKYLLAGADVVMTASSLLRHGPEHIAVLRVDGSLIFASAERILDEVTGLDRVTVVILRLSQLQEVDATGARVLSEIVTRLEARGVTVLIKGVRDRHAALFRGIGVMQALRHGDHLFTTLDAAIAHARHHIAGSPLRTE